MSAPFVQLGWWDQADESCVPRDEDRSFLLSFEYNSFVIQLIAAAL